MQKELKVKLDQAHGAQDYAEITRLISEYLEQRFHFQPGFSDFSEIVIDYLDGGMFSDPVTHIHLRYEVTLEQAASLYNALKLFADYRG